MKSVLDIISKGIFHYSYIRGWIQRGSKVMKIVNSFAKAGVWGRGDWTMESFTVFFY